MGRLLEAITCAELADLAVVQGDPLADIAGLQDRRRLSALQGGRWATRNI